MVRQEEKKRERFDHRKKRDPDHMITIIGIADRSGEKRRKNSRLRGIVLRDQKEKQPPPLL